MSAFGPTEPALPTAALPTAGLPARAWRGFESLLNAAGEWFNPILVKESRQALKSRQFVIVFLLLLAAAWGWTMFRVALGMPGLLYAPGGLDLLVGYVWILAFPLIVVVPFTAYRSLASEQEDGAFELLLITTLRPTQIIAGKLASAIAQMTVYFCALAPFVAFTYLLRGVDVTLLALLLFYTFFASLALSVVGLLLASATRTRHWQILLSVLFIVGLFLAFWGFAAFVTEGIAFRGWATDAYEDWVLQATVVSIVASYLALFFSAAAAELSFASDNRSTRGRVLALVQQALLLFWTAHWWIVGRGDGDVFVLFVVLGTAHWWIFGAMLTGESPVLSERVRRGLPRAVLGRMFLGWLQPGPGTGYFFALANLATLSAFVMALSMAAEWAPWLGWRARGGDRVFLLAFCLLCYVAGYAGLACLILRLARRHMAIGPVAALVLQAVLVLGGSLVSILVYYALWPTHGYGEYSWLLTPNPFWTCVYIFDRRQGFYWSDFLTLQLLVGFALLMIALNLALAAREVRYEAE